MYKVFLSSKICNIAATYLEFCDKQRGQDPLLSENLKYVDPPFQILAQKIIKVIILELQFLFHHTLF